MAKWRMVVIEYEASTEKTGFVEFETDRTGSALWAKAYKQAKADVVRRHGVANAFIVEMAVYNK